MSYEKLIALGAENVYPRLIARVDGVRQFVGEFVEGRFYVNPAGGKLLASAPVPKDGKGGKSSTAKGARGKTSPSAAQESGDAQLPLPLEPPPAEDLEADVAALFAD
jgi:hypothetical protein